MRDFENGIAGSRLLVCVVAMTITRFFWNFFPGCGFESLEMIWGKQFSIEKLHGSAGDFLKKNIEL